MWSYARRVSKKVMKGLKNLEFIISERKWCLIEQRHGVLCSRFPFVRKQFVVVGLQLLLLLFYLEVPSIIILPFGWKLTPLMLLDCKSYMILADGKPVCWGQISSILHLFHWHTDEWFIQPVWLISRYTWMIWYCVTELKALGLERFGLQFLQL